MHLPDTAYRLFNYIKLRNIQEHILLGVYFWLLYHMSNPVDTIYNWFNLVILNTFRLDKLTVGVQDQDKRNRLGKRYKFYLLRLSRIQIDNLQELYLVCKHFCLQL